MNASIRLVLRPRPVLAALLLVAACGPASEPGASPRPPRSVPELKLVVLDAVGGRLDYCDPDLFPVARGDPVQSARERLPTIEADRDVFESILEHEGISTAEEFTPDQLVAINEAYKKIQAIRLEPAGEAYRFSVLVPQGGYAAGNERVSGSVSRSGSVEIDERGPGEPLKCPICLASGARIATPWGEVPVETIRVGMRVWTTDRQGRRIVGVVLETGRTEVPAGHEVVRLTLADGRTVTVSPGHPTADGRRVGDLRPGETYHGSRVLAAARVPYAGGSTYDVLPSGPTGAYFAGGVLLGSSLGHLAVSD